MCINLSHFRLQVQEAGSGTIFCQMPDVWINLAHVYFAQGNHTLALKMVLSVLFAFLSISLRWWVPSRKYWLHYIAFACSIRIACENFSTIQRVNFFCILLGLIMKLSSGRIASVHYWELCICLRQIIHFDSILVLWCRNFQHPCWIRKRDLRMRWVATPTLFSFMLLFKFPSSYDSRNSKLSWYILELSLGSDLIGMRLLWRFTSWHVCIQLYCSLHCIYGYEQVLHALSSNYAEHFSYQKNDPMLSLEMTP